ncbi:hypothetical protein D3C73_1392940 [compost metagenome]
MAQAFAQGTQNNHRGGEQGKQPQSIRHEGPGEKSAVLQHHALQGQQPDINAQLLVQFKRPALQGQRSKAGQRRREQRTGDQLQGRQDPGAQQAHLHAIDTDDQQGQQCQAQGVDQCVAGTDQRGEHQRAL